jgi:hypothetical protein
VQEPVVAAARKSLVNAQSRLAAVVPRYLQPVCKSQSYRDLGNSAEFAFFLTGISPVNFSSKQA